MEAESSAAHNGIWIAPQNYSLRFRLSAMEVLSFIMLRHTPALDAVNAADERATVHRRTWHEALDVMLALWEEARALNPTLGDDWRADIESDIEVARTLNARP